MNGNHIIIAYVVATKAMATTEVIIGQDYWSISNYSATFGVPWGVMAYTSLRNLSGVAQPTNYGSGIEWIDGLLDKFPYATIQIGLYLVGDLEATANGLLDDHIDILRALGRRRRVLLRIGYEFDNPGNAYQPGDYVRAFRRIAMRAPSVETVWHSWGFGPADEGYWPGSDVVDWCAISIFQQAYDHTIAQFSTLCRDKKHMIAESTPFGLGDTVSESEALHDWFERVFMYSRDVDVWCYINCDWNSQPMWHGEGWGDTRLEYYPRLAHFWQRHVLPPSRLQWQVIETQMEPVKGWVLIACLSFFGSVLALLILQVTAQGRQARRMQDR